SENKLAHLEQPLIPIPLPVASQAACDAFETLFDSQNEVACLMIRIKAFHACKQEDGQSVSPYLLKMKGYLDTLERLGYPMSKELGVSLILNSLNKDYDQFVQNYNMHNMGKMIVELHAMLKLHEKGIPKKAETPAILTIREGRIQKDKKKPLGSKGKDKGKNKLAYAPKPKIPPPLKRDNPTNDSICHHYKEVGYWRRNCPSYYAELKKRKNASVTSTSGIFKIELYAFPNKSWVYDMGCGTHICNTSQGLRKSRLVYYDLYLGGKALEERENVGFDLTKYDLCPRFIEDHTAKGVGLRVADSHTGTDISQKDEKPSKKRQNRTQDGKVCEDEAQSKSSQLREEKAKKNIT
ncbi:zinc finger, CCHC-type containing protein, partial [Tanacetum coccineum]